MNEELKVILREVLQTKAICQALLVDQMNSRSNKKALALEALCDKMLRSCKKAYPGLFNS